MTHVRNNDCITSESLHQLGYNIKCLTDSVDSLKTLLECNTNICAICESLTRIAKAIESQGAAIRRDASNVAEATQATK